MEFKYRGSLIIISLLILILSIGMVSASEDIDTATDYQSDSIDNIVTDFNTDTSDSVSLQADTAILDKSKIALSDEDDDGGATDDGDDEDEVDESIYIEYNFSKEDAIYHEGENVQMNFSFAYDNGTPANVDCFINVYSVDDDSDYDEYYEFKMNEKGTYTFQDDFPIGNYVVELAEYDEDIGDYVIDTSKYFWLNDDNSQPEFSVVPDYDKQINAELTLDGETDTFTPEDAITASISLLDNDDNPITANASLILYLLDDMTGEDDMDAIDKFNVEIIEGKSEAIIFDNLEVGEYLLVINNVTYNSVAFTNVDKNNITFYVEDDGEDDPEYEEIYLAYELSNPENRTYLEGEEFSVILYAEDAAGYELDVNVVLNLFDYNDDEGIDYYYPFEIDGNSTFKISEYIPPAEYVLYIGNYDEEGEYSVMYNMYWRDELEEEYIDFFFKTNYNKKVYANLTVGYDIAELNNLTEGDNITAAIRLTDEFKNLLDHDEVELVLYKWDEDEEEYVEANHDTRYSSYGQVGPFRFDDLEEGEYYIAVKKIEHLDEFDDDWIEFNNIITNKINFTVKSKIDPNDYKVYLDADEVRLVGDACSIGIKLLDPYNETCTGTVDLYINDEYKDTIELDYEDADFFKYIICDIPIGLSEAKFVYNITDGLNTSSSVILTSYEYATEINVDASDIIIGNDAVIKVNLTTINDNLDYELLNKTFTVTITNYNPDEEETPAEKYEKTFTVTGEDEITLEGLDLGTYYISAVFDGEDYQYCEAITDTYFHVLEKETIVDVYTKAYSIEEDAIAIVVLDDLNGNFLEGEVTLVVDGDASKTYKVNTTTDLDNPAIINMGKLAYGIHNITASFAGSDDGWLANTTQKEFMAIYPTYIDIEGGEVKSGGDITVNIDFTSANGVKLNETIYVRVYDIDGKNLFYDKFVAKDGKVSIDLKNITKDQIVNAWYEGLDSDIIDEYGQNETYYLSSEGYGYIKVTDKPGQSTINATLDLSYDNKNTITVSLKDLDSNPIANASLKVNVNGAESTIKTNSNGIATITVSGNTSAKVTYTDPATKADLTGTVAIIENQETILPSGAITLTTTDGSTAIASLKDNAGMAISNAKITFNVNGKETEATTDSNGEAKITVEGNSTITASYKDQNNLTVMSSLNIINNTVEKIVIPNRTATQIVYKDMKTVAVNVASDGRVGEYFKVTLKDASGKALAGKFIEIGFNGKKYNRTTDENGSAKLQINLAREDIYTFAVAFLGDDDYTGSFVVAVINVTKQTPKLTTSNKSYKTTAKTKSLTATFKTALGNPIKGKKISFTVNGKTYTASTNAKGVATVKVSINKKGTYSFTVKYAGDTTFKAVSKSAKLTLT